MNGERVPFLHAATMKGEAAMNKPDWFEYAVAYPLVLPLWVCAFVYLFMCRLALADVSGAAVVFVLLLLWLHSYLQSAKHLFEYYAAQEPSSVVSGQLSAKKGWLLALCAVLTFAYVLYWLSQHSFTQDTPHYVIALVIAGWLTLLPLRFCSRSVRVWAKCLLLLVISALGAAGLWLVSHPVQLFDSFPTLVPLIVTYPDLSVYLLFAAMACAFLPAVLLLTMLLPRKVAV